MLVTVKARSTGVITDRNGFLMQTTSVCPSVAPIIHDLESATKPLFGA